MATGAVTPLGISHIVLNVRDIEVAHRFWTDVMGFRQVGELENNPRMTMRFYTGSQEGHHHDLALAQVLKPEEAEPPAAWSMAARRPGLNHVAINYPDRESWLQQLAHLQACGVPFHVRGDHGMSHSVYISDPDGHGIEVLYDLPEEVWSGDLNAALNYFKPLPTEGDEALQDDADYRVFTPSR
jgi:catechol 2,3-dioxygenase